MAKSNQPEATETDLLARADRGKFIADEIRTLENLSDADFQVAPRGQIGDDVLRKLVELGRSRRLAELRGELRKILGGAA